MPWRSRSMSSTLTSTVWPISSTSDGWFTWLQESSEMWIRPSIPSRSTKAPKSTMLEICPSTTSPGLRLSRIFWRCSLRSSSSTARRERTTLLRERLSSMTLDMSSWPMNSSRSCTRRMSTSDAGRKPRTPRSRMSPPLTTSITLPVTGSPDSAAPSMRFHASSKRGRFFERISRPSAPSFGTTRRAAPPVLLREDERVGLLAHRHLVGRIDRAADRELVDRDDALGLVADVHEHLVLVDADDRAVHDLALVDRREGRLVVRNELAVRAFDPDSWLVLEACVGHVESIAGHKRGRSIAGY